MTTTTDVRIVQLAPMRVVCFSGFGPNPEELAWNQLTAWNAKHGLQEYARTQRFFGFNNPSPSPGSPNYGYDQWMTVGTELVIDDAQVIEFSGGLYAVLRCTLRDITAVWGELASWCEQSRYRMANHQWLEECLTLATMFSPTPEESQMDLYLPIAE